MAEKLRNTLRELITWNLSLDNTVLSSASSSSTRPNPKVEAILKFALDKCSKHHTAVYAPSVYDTYDRIIERFAVLGRTDLRSLLEERINELDRDNYITAQALFILHILSKNPEQKLCWNPVLNSNLKKSGHRNDPQSWEEILQDDPLPLDQDHWKLDIEASSDDDSSLNLLENDNLLDQGKNSDLANGLKDTRMNQEFDDSELMSKSRAALSTADEDLQILLQTTDFILDEGSAQQNPFASAETQQDRLALKYDQLYDAAYWNNILDLSVPDDGNVTIISEHTAIREIIFAIRGQPSSLYSAITGDPITSVKISTISSIASLDILETFKVEIDKINTIRAYFEHPGTQKIPLSVFGAAIEKHILGPLDEFLDGYVGQMINSKLLKSDSIISIMSFKSQLRRLASVWSCIFSLVSRILDCSSGQDYTKFSFIINELYTACNVSYSGILAKGDYNVDEHSMKPTDDLYKFNQIIFIFQDTFKFYGSIFDNWMRQGRLNTEDLFVVREHTDSNVYMAPEYFWASKYSVDFNKIPPFLSDTLCQQMYEAGMSILLYRNINRRHDGGTHSLQFQRYLKHITHTDLASSTSCFDTIFFDLSKGFNASESSLAQQLLASPSQVWWSKFQDNMERWVQYYHEHNTRLLEVRLFNDHIDDGTGNLRQFLAQYISTYIMQDVKYNIDSQLVLDANLLFPSSTVSSDFRYELFTRFDKFANERLSALRAKKQPDKYVVQDDFEESVKKYLFSDSPYLPKLLFLSASSSGILSESLDRTTADNDSYVSNSFDEKIKQDQSELDYISHLKLAYPIPWIVREIVRDKSSVYQEIWVLLLQWAWARHVVSDLHMENMKRLGEFMKRETQAPADILSSLQSQCLTTHSALVFINNISEYFNDSALAMLATKFLDSIAPTSGLTQGQSQSQEASAPTNLNDSQSQAGPAYRKSYRSFQSIINHHERFIRSVCDLCFLAPSCVFSESSNSSNSNSGLVGDTSLDTASFTQTKPRHTRDPTKLKSRTLYVQNIQKALNRILYYCAVTLVQDKDDLFYTNFEYFSVLVKGLKKAINLGLNNYCFGENSEHVERFLHRI